MALNDYIVEVDRKQHKRLVMKALTLLLKEIRSEQQPGRGDSCQLQRIGAYRLKDEILRLLDEHFDKQRAN